MSDESPVSSDSQAAIKRAQRWGAIAMILVAVAFALATFVYLRRSQPEATLTSNSLEASPTEGSSNARASAGEDTPNPDVVEGLQRRFTKGMEERDERRIASVRDELQILLEKHPKSAELRTFMAQILLFEERRPAAYEQFELSLQINRQQPEVHLLAGTVAMQMKEYDKAIEHYTMATGLSPRSSRYLIHLANAYLLIGKPDQARDTFLQALSVDSSAHQAYKGLSDLFAQQGKLELALDQIQKAIDQTPASQRMMQVLYIRHKAGLLRRANRPSDALLLLQTLSSAERKDLGTLKDLAITWILLEQPAKAAEEYEQVMPDRPMDPVLLAEAARWRFRAGDTKKAAEHLEVLRRIAPNFPDLRELDEMMHKKSSE